MKKIILIIFGAIILSYIAFICEESIRLKNDSESTPVIVLDQTFCDKDSFACYEANGGEFIKEYNSLGFSFYKRYALDEGSTEKSFNYHLIGEEFYLFNKFLIWAWIS